MARTINETGLAHIKQWEGLRLTAYLCSAGELTIGYGHTSSAGAPVVKNGMTITEAEAEAILERDLKQYERAVEQSVKVDLTDNQFAALVSFVYNVGIRAFKRSTLLKKLNKGDYNAVPSQLMRWVKATRRKTGKKVNVEGLVNRRGAEVGLWTKGAFVSSSYDTAAPATESVALKPEVLAPAVATLSGLTGFASGSGPAQWAFAAIMVGVFALAVFFFFKRRKAQTA